MESWWLYARSGRTYAYSFSLYFSKEIPLTSERLVIAQWKQLCEARRCRPDYPILAIRLENAHVRVSRRDEGGSHVLYEGSGDARGRWLDFRFLVKFDSISGIVDATLDGKTIVHYHGATVFQTAHRYPERGLVYFDGTLSGRTR